MIQNSNNRFLMGNEAMALGAIHAGLQFASGYPGTPSTEILETVAAYKREHESANLYVEWSVNEKAALEVAAGASYAGARVLVTMKQVGLNVASDPLLSLRYVGINGGFVLAVADDPGPISSQTEQDTRHFAAFAKLPLFDPSSPEEAYQMMIDAYEYSERYKTPVIIRPTTRICHGYASVALDAQKGVSKPASGFVKDSKWVIFPSLTYKNKLVIEKQMPEIAKELGELPYTAVVKPKIKAAHSVEKTAIAAGGIGYAYAMEALGQTGLDLTVFKCATFPIAEEKALAFLQTQDKVLVVEELDPVIEKALVYICGKYKLTTQICGKLTGHMPNAGEYSSDGVAQAIKAFVSEHTITDVPTPTTQRPNLPIRPPVLCAGCPHRASFYAVKSATKGMKAVYTGDIGCYTLGNAAPLNMVDTCLCMGAGITVAQGLKRIDQDVVHIAFIGDSTFFHTGIPGIINAVYNKTDIMIVILDNSTTAMTGGQPHPGTGKTATQTIAGCISIPDMLKAMGVQRVQTVDPFKYDEALKAVQDMATDKGVRALIFKAPCIVVNKEKPQETVSVDKVLCTGCKICVNRLGCPAIALEDGKAVILGDRCTHCGLCTYICPTKSIKREKEVEHNG